jgi:hypothetical protein
VVSDQKSDLQRRLDRHGEKMARFAMNEVVRSLRKGNSLEFPSIGLIINADALGEEKSCFPGLL